jgi:hypothetical protein
MEQVNSVLQGKMLQIIFMHSSFLVNLKILKYDFVFTRELCEFDSYDNH